MTLDFKNLHINMDNVVNYLLIFLGFFLSTSVFVSDLLIFGIVLIWLAKGNWSTKLRAIKSNHFAVAIILFLIFYVLGGFWGDFNLDAWRWIRKQAILIMIPVMVSMSIPKKIITKTLLAFLSGMFLNALMSMATYLKFVDTNYHHYPNENVAIGLLDHFDHSVFLAFSTIIIIAQFIEITNPKKKLIYFIIMLLFLVSLFLSHGRAGQYVFLISVVLFLIIRFLNAPRHLMFSISLVCVALIGLNIFSSTFNKRLNQGLAESVSFFNLVQHSSTNTQDITVTDTAIGDRLTYWVNYSKIVKNNFWFGCGTGKSIIEYQLLESKIFPNVPARPPHNNYLFILCEVGIIGLFFWLNIFVQLFIQIYKNCKSVKADFIKFLLPIIFILICFTDEYLVRHNPTLFFCFFSTLFCIRKEVSIRDFQI